MNTSGQGRDTPNTFVGSEVPNDVEFGDAVINLLSDPSHLIKKLVNHLFKSGRSATSPRDLRMPDYLVQMILKCVRIVVCVPGIGAPAEELERRLALGRLRG